MLTAGWAATVGSTRQKSLGVFLFHVQTRTLPCLRAGWPPADLEPSLPPGPEVTPPVTRRPSARLTTKSSLGTNRKCVQTNWCAALLAANTGGLLTRAPIERCDQGPADEEDHGSQLTGVLQTALDVHDRLRRDLPPQLPAACCRQRHHTVN